MPFCRDSRASAQIHLHAIHKLTYLTLEERQDNQKNQQQKTLADILLIHFEWLHSYL